MAEDRALLDHLARDVEWQVGGIHEAAHEAQVARQNLGFVGDEHAFDVELDAPLAAGSNRSNGRELGTKTRAVYSCRPSARKDREGRLVELAGKPG